VVDTQAAASVARTNAAHVQGAHVVTMSGAQKVCQQREVGKDDLDGQALSRLVVSALIYDESEVISLQHEAKVDQDATLAAQKHTRFH